jgi:hypothetical protein
MPDGILPLGREKRKRKREKRQCTFYTGILLGKMAKVARF